MISFILVLSLLVICALTLGFIVQTDVQPGGKLTLIVAIIATLALLIGDKAKESYTLDYLVSKELGYEIKNDKMVDTWIQNRIKRTKIEIELEVTKEQVYKKYTDESKKWKFS